MMLCHDPKLREWQDGNLIVDISDDCRMTSQNMPTVKEFDAMARLS